MKLLRRLVYVVAAALAVLLTIGLLLPDSAHVERSVTTSASPQTVYGLVDGYARFNEWSPWADLDPATRYTYSGPPTGVGARLEWRSDKPEVGSGSQEIVAVEPGRRVTTKLDFGTQGTATSTMSIEPEGTGSRITWSIDASFEGRFLERYFGLFFDRLIGPDYEKGLSRLAALAEATPPAP